MKAFRALFLGAALALFLPSAPLRAVIDQMENGGAGDGMGDIWQLLHGMTGASPTADSDGDGATNANEAGAGTDPHTPGNLVKVNSILIDSGNTVLTWSSVVGKRYRIQTTTTLTNPASWTEATAYQNGTGAELTGTTPAVPGTFYRIAVYDMDSDGDGVTDWEELQVGLDPENDRSHGLNGPSDLAWLTGALNAPNVVSVSAEQPVVSESSVYPDHFIVKRSGGIKPLTVHYTVSGPATAGTDYQALSGVITIPMGANSAMISVQPIADTTVESAEAVIVTLTSDASYTVGQPGAAGILIDEVSTANGNGLTAQFWNEGTLSATVPPSFPGTPTLTRTDATVDFDWPDGTSPSSPATTITANNFSSRWTGEVRPDFAQIYTFSFTHNRGGRVWVNGTLLVNNWPPNLNATTTVTGTGAIALEAGRRYPIVVEQFDESGSAQAHLKWQSANQINPATGLVELHVIPQSRLFSTVAPQILSSLDVLTFIGGPTFSYQIVASGNPGSPTNLNPYSAANLPPGLSIDTATGLISGSPTLPGVWAVPISAKNAVGSGSALLNITVLQAGGGVVREKWTSLPGSSVSTLPLGTPPNSTSLLTSSLQAPSNDGDDYGVRIRGYVTAPVTGVYQFWLAADEAAELYISDNDDPVNAWKRAELLAPSSVPPTWTTAAKAPLLYLTAGFRYYIEVRHKESAGSDFLAVGWSKPGEPTTAPSEIVPAYLLAQYVPPTPGAGSTVLYTTSLSAQGQSITGGYGSAVLQVSADETEAVLTFTYANLTSPRSAAHIHSDPWNGKPSQIIFDIDSATPQPDGSYVWHIVDVGVYTVADIRQLIKDGAAYLNVHSANYLNGEIRGNFKLTAGSQTFVPPPAPPSWADDHTDEAAGSRFLAQATFGATSAEIASVNSLGYSGWIDAQFSKPITLHMPAVNAFLTLTNPQNQGYLNDYKSNSWWEKAVTADDQLRQRVAFALSEILVISQDGPLDGRADAQSDYYDMLLAGHLDPVDAKNKVNPVVTPVPLNIPGFGSLNAGAFGNFRDVLLSTTLHPAMGRYLDMLRNDKPNIATGLHPNENYAREILQLFSLGLNRLHPDGSLVLDSRGLPVATYDQDAIIGFAHAFTGWEYSYAGVYKTSFNAGSNWIEPMREVPANHYTGQKRVLNNVVLPGLFNVTSGATTYPVDPDADYAGNTGNNQIIRDTPEFTGLAAQEMIATHNQIFNHPNIGPFICRQLIQRMVTSTPSRGYIYRVVQKFNDNGSGVRGDMKAVIKAILLDYEARSPVARAAQGYGKQREPVLRVTQMARALAPANTISGTYAQDGGSINITTPTPHRVGTSQAVVLNFSTGSPASTSGTYSQSTLGNTAPTTDATHFSVRTKDVLRCTYQQTSSSVVTVTTQSSAAHGFVAGNKVYVRFRDGLLSGSGDLYPVTVGSTTSFTIPAVANMITASGLCDVAFLKGGYYLPQPAVGVTTNTVTVYTTTIHGLSEGASVWASFTPDTSGSGSYAPADGTYSIHVLDPESFSFTATYPVGATGTVSNNILVGPATPVLNRTGAVGGNYGDYTMANTDTDLSQTPIGSPTVFNFFLPDYQYPGELAAAGLVTPEFQLTSDTTTVKQSNFLYNALFTGANFTTGLSSFKSGSGDVPIDIFPWMQNRPTTSLPWADNNLTTPADDNLHLLIRKLATLLMGGPMSSGMEAVIYDYLTLHTSSPTVYTNSAYTNGGTATDTQKRDRVRAIVHFIVTSPEYTIQK